MMKRTMTLKVETSNATEETPRLIRRHTSITHGRLFIFIIYLHDCIASGIMVVYS